MGFLIDILIWRYLRQLLYRIYLKGEYKSNQMVSIFTDLKFILIKNMFKMKNPRQIIQKELIIKKYI